MTGQIESINPPLKWAGGKRWLPIRHSNLLPDRYDHYYEPFFGGGAIFFSMQPEISTLSDINRDLICTYQQIRDNHEDVESLLSMHATNHSKEYFYKIRDLKPDGGTALAAWFLYMNRSCYNGLYRVNKNGKFNVPKGTKDKILFDTDKFSSVSKRLKTASILCSDFENTISKASQSDFIYADPPYTVRHNTNGFLKYNENIFSWEDQERLFRSIKGAAERGAKILVSNADHSSVRELYSNLGKIMTLDRYSVIGGGASYRSSTSEIAIKINY